MIAALLPFAEWRFIGLPLRGRPIVIDFNNYLSVSVFDLVFVFFTATCIPLIWRTYKRKIFFNWYLVWWVICGILIVVLFIQQRPMLPWLNLTVMNVIDVRSLIIHFALAVCVTVTLAQIPFSLIIKGAQMFYIAFSIGAAILCYFALTANLFFLANYPFTAPQTIAFPFSSQNMAAMFMVLCLIGFYGAALTRNIKAPLLLCAPIFLLAVGLTGSRSNMFICCLIIVAYAISYMVYYRKLTCGWLGKCKPSHPSILLISLFIGIILIFVNIDWHPIKRSLSIFSDFLDTPTVLFTGGKDTPRSQLWSMVIQNRSSEGNPDTSETSRKTYQPESIKESSRKGNPENGKSAEETRTFSVGLTSIENGCKNLSSDISALKTDRIYYVRLTIYPNGETDHLAVLNVFENSERNKLVGSTEMIFRMPTLAKIYYFIADNGHNIIDVDADIYSFKKMYGNKTDTKSLKHDAFIMHEEPFNGGSQSAFFVTDNVIRIKAKERRLRGYISETDRVCDNKKKLILEYTMNVRDTIYNGLLQSPVMFYVGLGESVDSLPVRNWQLIRNGLLISHKRQLSSYEQSVQLQTQKANFEYWMKQNNEKYSHLDLAKLFNCEVRCGKGGYNLISRLWEPLIPEDVEMNIKGKDIYRISSDKVETKRLLSVEPDETWSPYDQLANRGSTHNVYLDWYQYVGPIPFGIYLMLMLSLLVAFAHFTWKSRSTREFPFILSVFCQLLVIATLMYAHPYIWLKYIWFVFGLATALMIHPNFNKHNSNHA